MAQLKAKTRTSLGKKNQALRKKGLIPACVYGHKIKNQNIELDAPTFNNIFKQAGETSLLDLQVDDKKPVKVIVQEVDHDTLKDEILHADFYQIREDEKLSVDVELEFINQSKAVEEEAGVLVKSLDTIKIQCLPADLIHKIEVDISALENFGDVIYAKDLKVTEKVEIMDSPDTAVVSVAAPRSEKELEALEEKPEDAELPEGAEEAKEGEEEEGASEDKKASGPDGDAPAPSNDSGQPRTDSQGGSGAGEDKK
ncbi:50S ribosomal protein L25 [Candidatus Falkowbacteria bacterium]|nr:50S ribosomal protein L25 [Candidatus Falkowbacteria bacterium]